MSRFDSYWILVSAHVPSVQRVFGEVEIKLSASLVSICDLGSMWSAKPHKQVQILPDAQTELGRSAAPN